MLKDILVGAGLVLFGVGSTWFGLTGMVYRVRAIAALRARGRWAQGRALLWSIGCTSFGVAFVLLGAAALWICVVTLTIAPHHAPPIVRVLMIGTPLIMDVATVLGLCGVALMVIGKMAVDLWDDGTPGGVDLEAADHHLVYDTLDTMRRRQGAVETGQAPREVSRHRSLFEIGSSAWTFRASLLCILVPGIFMSIVDIASGTFAVAFLVELVLFALGFAAIMTAFIESSWAIASVLSRRDGAKMRRMRQGTERHHP